MKELYLSSHEILFCDPVAKQFVSEGRDAFHRAKPDSQNILKKGAIIRSSIDRLREAPLPDMTTLLANFKNLKRAKWDRALSDTLLRKSYGSLYLNLEEAREWINCFS